MTNLGISAKMLNYEKLLKAAEIYDEISNDDEYYRNFMSSKNKKEWDNPAKLSDREVEKLFEFLNKWRCRIKITDELRHDFKLAYKLIYLLLGYLQDHDIRIENFEENRILSNIISIPQIIVCIYEELNYIEGIGPTSISKILHTIIPDLFVMWDENIRDAHKVTPTGCGYAYEFLPKMKQKAEKVISSFMNSNNCTKNAAVKEIKQKLNGKSLPKVLDEYNYVKYTLKKEI